MELPQAFPITTEVWVVPCRVTQKKLFSPLCKPFDDIDLGEYFKPRNSWKPEEDLALEKIIKSRGPKNWSSIAKQLNVEIHDSLPVRKGKQCRERWFNHLNPLLIKTKWTETEDQILISQQQTLGNKWSEISKFLPGRTENQAKNRWKSLKKRQGKRRRINRPKILIIGPAEESKSRNSFNIEPSPLLLEAGSPYSLEDIDSSGKVLHDFSGLELDFSLFPHEGPAPIRMSSLTSDSDLLLNQGFNFCAIKASPMQISDTDRLYNDRNIENGQDCLFQDVLNFNIFQPWSWEENFSFNFQKNLESEAKLVNDSNCFSPKDCE